MAMTTPTEELRLDRKLNDLHSIWNLRAPPCFLLLAGENVQDRSLELWTRVVLVQFEGIQDFEARQYFSTWLSVA